jgi:hypothetical protein
MKHTARIDSEQKNDTQLSGAISFWIASQSYCIEVGFAAPPVGSSIAKLCSTAKSKIA